MSDSKQRKAKPTTSDPDGSPRRRNRDGSTLWYLLSLGLHVAAFLALITLTPLRELVPFEKLAPKEPEKTMSSDQLQELAEVIEIRAQDQIRDNVVELERVLTEIDKLEESMTEEFTSFEQHQLQTAADDAMQEMEKAIEQLEKATEALENDADMATIDRHQTLAEQAQQRAEQKLELVAFDVSAATKEHAAAQEAHETAKTSHDTRQAQERVLTIREVQVVEQAEDVKSIEADIAKRKEAAAPAKDLLRLEKTAAQRRERLKTAQAEIKQLEQTTVELQAAAVKAQRESLNAQQRALEALKQTVAAHQQERIAPPPPESSPQNRAEREARIAATDIPELYDDARVTEDDIAEKFKEVRAMDLAMVRDLKLEEARKDIELVRPVRPDLQSELLREDVRTDERFEAHKEELQKALRETSSMVNLAHMMLEMANQSVEGMKFGAGVELAEEAAGEQEFQLLIEELAMEDVSGRFSDMAGVMMQAAAAEGAEEGDAGAETAPPPVSIDYENLTEEEELAAKGALAITDEGEEAGVVPVLDRDVPAIGARRIGSVGQPGRWWYIDSWYTLGPFPNPNRVNIDREFPPDSVVDLDASYIGKGGRTIRWQFVQSDETEVVPPNAEEYGIWYAYTELYFDEARDMLIALGSDDRGILKINGVTVWISSRRLKGWDIDEVWRKVHFRKGVNRILYRVENGWMHIAYSMMIRMPDEE